MENVSNEDIPFQRGLYDFTNEHDACGVGLVANVDGQSTHRIVQQGIEVLIRLLHRGAVGGDIHTGDGAGILLQIPFEYFSALSAAIDISLPDPGKYAVGMVFLPKDKNESQFCSNIVEETIRKNGFNFLGWREVPTDNATLGELAKKTQPIIRQFFLSRDGVGAFSDEFESDVYVLRREIENLINKSKRSPNGFYICSLSSRTIVYKGLLMATQLPELFGDLTNELVKSAFAIVHQRYSTNTFPTWPLAQPFRYLAHNGEINTLKGNVNRMRAREKALKSEVFGNKISHIIPIIQENQSDSACLDNALELLIRGGRSLAHSIMMLVPQAWGEQFHIGHDLKGFYDYHSGIMEPWDGPAALAFTDGIGLGALLDRNGLRPARYTITKDNFIVLASETGVLDFPPENIKAKGHLRPGQMIFVDLKNKRIQFDDEIKNSVARHQPYRRWVDENRIALHGFFDSVEPPVFGERELIELMKLYGYNREEVNMILRPMAENAHEAVGSMGNDAALAVLSEKPQLLFNYFKQLFAQVTNPPIDPIRERLVMSLMTFIGNHPNILEEKPQNAHLLKLRHPILTNEDVERIMMSPVKTFKARRIEISFENKPDEPRALEKGINRVLAEVDDAVSNSINVIVLSDKSLPKEKIPIPSLLAVAAVNNHLVSKGTRIGAGIVIETGECREIMHYALLLGYGATAINPYLALSTVVFLVNRKYIVDRTTTLAMENYIKAVSEGLLKIMSKMGISTLRSYRGAQVFEAIGLNESVVSKYFPGTASRIGGINIEDIQREAFQRHTNAYSNKQGVPLLLEPGGEYHFRIGGEKHLWTPETISKFQFAVRNNSLVHYQEYAQFINNQEKHLCTLRGLFAFKPKKSIPLSEVEPATEIVKRFVTGAMSFGSISKEAHESIAIAMNRLGGMSNSGEGGEDPERYNPLPNNDSLCSAIKQVASGRFGVTAEYLAHAKELQIKVAQGAKPGEGGQLPGHKVDATIARVRHSTPGVSLISPPPHHDIYSIEDLAQLIYDLKNANPEARISVKLVSEVGVGTVAAGVAKGHADMVLISGHDGGTGASPLTSIKHAGVPWELGLAETQQTLVLNNLRSRIRVQVDGQLKTGRDVVIAALLGAEEFGFATTILVSLGCVMMRKCHSNTCPVGVATQDPELRKKFTGKPEYVQNFLMFIAEEVREYLALLGYKKLDEIIGKSELLDFNKAIGFWKTKNLDFSKIFEKIEDKKLPVKRTQAQDHGIDKAFDLRIIEKARTAIESATKINLEFPIENVHRTAGTMLSYHVAKKYGNKGLPEDTINVKFKGCAGQSFGAFLAKGITFNLEGEANDYVGKGLAGGKIIIKPYSHITYNPSENTIAGNVILYGATSGEIYIYGRAGERFAIRNSGACAVVESVGDHCCEYMTSGRVAVIGPTGNNFAAGMSGGIAYVFDELNLFDQKCNLDMVDLESVVFEDDKRELRNMIEKHYHYTGSKKAKSILDDWENCLPKFVKVFPMEYRKVLGQMLKEDADIKRVQMNY
ncbi:MAG TPA: glutamate synthase large subunit [Lentisphaeria bacterium]|nr:MAG: glutamate synthase subunit alpha [Lentisphaerae bacterium GWF2_38_69]HBM15710.1 glutamate synthase large subunit [Lentisphaeria bacterium]